MILCLYSALSFNSFNVHIKWLILCKNQSHTQQPHSWYSLPELLKLLSCLNISVLLNNYCSSDTCSLSPPSPPSLPLLWSLLSASTRLYLPTPRKTSSTNFLATTLTPLYLLLLPAILLLTHHHLAVPEHWALPHLLFRHNRWRTWIFQKILFSGVSDFFSPFIAFVGVWNFPLSIDGVKV